MPMQLLWHRQNDLSKFVELGTREQTFEPVKSFDELVKVADDLWVIAAKVQNSHSLGYCIFSH